MHAVWEKKDYIASLLFLDITGIFNQIISSYLVYILHIKRILEKLAE